MITLDGLIEGNVGKADLGFTPGGKPVFKFSVAVTNNYWDKVEAKEVERPPSWYNFAIWGKEHIERFGWLTKGMHVLVKFSGLEVREYDTKAGKHSFSLEPKFISDVWEVVFHKKVDLDLSSASDPGNDELSL